MKLIFFLATFYILIHYPAQGQEYCEELIKTGGKYYWFNSAVSGTSILMEDKELRIWYVNSGPGICYESKQSEINNHATIYTGNIMALKELGSDNNPANLAKIKKITGISFKDSDQFKHWFNLSRNNLFWSYEKNRIIVLENGFRCEKITSAGGKLYWFNYSLGAVKDMDTSADKRLWSDPVDNIKCFISPLSEINNHEIMISGFKLALKHVGSSNEKLKQRIIDIFIILTNNDRLMVMEIMDTN